VTCAREQYLQVISYLLLENELVPTDAPQNEAGLEGVKLQP
jgi:hypothetical protein